MTRDQIIERLNALKGKARKRRHGFAPTLRGDHSLNAGTPDMRHPGPLTTAAVLVPLVDRPRDMTVLLTQRNAHLNEHAGQVSFPGGRMEPQDPDPEHAALREAQEEVGLTPDHVTPIVRLDDYETRTGYLIYPVVGIVTPPFALKPDPSEVADVFEVPLSFILAAENARIESRMYKEYERHFYAFTYEGRYIWGATAGMLVNLREALTEPADA